MKNPNGYHRNCNICTDQTCMHNPKANPYLIENNKHNALVAAEQARVKPYSTGLSAADRLTPIWKTEYCTLEEELNNHHQNVIIATTDDAYKLLHNFWVDAGRSVATLSTYVLAASDGVAKPVIDASKLMYAFDDFGVMAETIEVKGKTFITFSSKNNGNKRILHALVGGVRIKANSTKKYPIDSPKMQQLGFAPKARMEGYKGAGVATFIISASIATTDLILDDDYHLVNWFGAVGTDMFKALLQVGASELILLSALTLGVPVISGVLVFVAVFLATEIFFSYFEVSDKITKELEGLIDAWN